MMQLFGLTLPGGMQDVPPLLASALAARMTSAATALEQGASAAVSAGLRQDARDFLDARRRGELRLPLGAARRCDDTARALLRLTADAPALRPAERRLVA